MIADFKMDAVVENGFMDFFFNLTHIITILSQVDKPAYTHKTSKKIHIETHHPTAANRISVVFFLTSVGNVTIYLNRILNFKCHILNLFRRFGN